MLVIRVALLTLVALAGCGRGKAGSGADGTERGACYGNGTCNAGLSCLSNRCVRPPGADCDAVAEALATLELGNYAPREQRKPKVVQIVAMCRAEHLTKDEGACLLDKQTKDELVACPKPLIVAPLSAAERQALQGQTEAGLPAACNEYLRVLERYAACPQVPPEAARALRQSIAQMRQQWLQLGQGTMPAAVGDACRQGLGAMKQAMAQLGCP